MAPGRISPRRRVGVSQPSILPSAGTNDGPRLWSSVATMTGLPEEEGKKSGVRAVGGGGGSKSEREVGGGGSTRSERGRAERLEIGRAHV